MERETLTNEWWRLTEALRNGEIEAEDRPVVEARIAELVEMVKTALTPIEERVAVAATKLAERFKEERTPQDLGMDYFAGKTKS